MLKGRDNPRVRKMLSMAMWMVLAVAPLQAFIGDQHGLNTLEYQPAKIAAMEGHWENKPGEGVPLILFAWPDQAAEKNHFEIAIPNLSSLILTHSLDGQFPGLKEFAPEDRPPVAVVFWTFRVMVGLGLLMITLGFWAAWRRWRGTLYQGRWLHRFALVMGPTGLIAMLAGWYTTEIGRQPWVIQGVMRTKDAVSDHSTLTMSVTLVVFVIAYIFVFGIGTSYMLKLVARGPEAGEEDPATGNDDPGHSPARPLSAAPDLRKEA